MDKGDTLPTDKSDDAAGTTAGAASTDRSSSKQPKSAGAAKLPMLSKSPVDFLQAREAKQAYPKASVFATTLRQVVNTNCHLWGAIMAEGDNWHVVEPREIGVLDRIGGGDGFVGGMLYAILRGWDPEKWVQFGWANGALVTTLYTDYSQPADEEQIWSIWEGNARVKR